MILIWPQDEVEIKTYEVKKSKQEIKIDGKGSDPLWAQAGLLTDFQLPWRDEIAQPTTFRAIWTDSSLFILYQAIDHDIVAPGPALDKRGVLPSDRVEIFFKVKNEMDPYYCLELDPRARVLDYKSHYYRQTDFEWSWPSGHLTVMANTSEEGYTVEAKISLQSLRELEVINPDNTIDAGLFRGDFIRTGASTSIVKWISWIRPDSDKPDFHIPSAFGKLTLVDQKIP
ncbi:MAG: carbohydrate-binding family 9-like protein [Saprospiraceae bacterium]|nr:carbohydrate-binding family 9-like protein [Saprospiraceae bacterium]